MSVVEDEGFCRLLECLELRYSLPSRKYFYDTGIQCIINSTMILDRYCIGMGYRQIHKAQASLTVSGLKKSDQCIPIQNTFSKVARYSFVLVLGGPQQNIHYG